jgi:mRNA interferase RelE/StbE
MYRIIYHPKVVKEDISKLDQKTKNRIKKSIESKLLEHPELYSNQLRNTLSNYRKLRVGDYRVIFKIMKKEIRILIIGHRKDVYKVVLNRY